MDAAMDLETGFIILGFKDVFRHYRLLPIVPDIVVDGHNVLGRPLTGTRIVPMFVRPYIFMTPIPISFRIYLAYSMERDDIGVVETVERFGIVRAFKYFLRAFLVCAGKSIFTV